MANKLEVVVHFGGMAGDALSIDCEFYLFTLQIAPWCVGDDFYGHPPDFKR